MIFSKAEKKNLVEEFCIFANRFNVWLLGRRLLLHSICCNITCCVASRKFYEKFLCAPMSG